MSDRLLATDSVFESSFPRLSRRLRIGIVGGGRIAVTRAMAARLSDRCEVRRMYALSMPQWNRTRRAAHGWTVGLSYRGRILEPLKDSVI